MSTADNNRFVRYWQEVSIHNTAFGCDSDYDATISMCKWFPYNKGGGYRKWYGNNMYVVNWENDGTEIKRLAEKLYGCVTKTIKNINFYFKPSITWSFIATNPGFRKCNKGFIFDVVGSSLFVDKNKESYILGFLSSNVTKYILEMLNPTMNIQAQDLKSLPLLQIDESKNVDCIVEDNISIAQFDWDSFETSWDFKKHPLI